MSKPESAVETLKRESQFLRGNVSALLDDEAPKVSPDAYQLLKFHGTYQQFDRDTATERKKAGLEKEYQFMVRVRIPGGRLTAEQYLQLDSMSDRVANGTMRLTTRQDIQFHGVLKHNLRSTIAEINHMLLSTISACGDVVRNVTAPATPLDDEPHRRLLEDLNTVGQHVLPRTPAYHEIWLDGDKLTPAEEVREPLYGETYLPRKFKIGFALPEDNSVDVLINDVAVIALWQDGRLEGYNIAIGGSLGMTHNKVKTYPRLASPLLFAEPEQLVPVIDAIIRVQRDYGDRVDRRHARLKYLLDDQGDAWFRAKVEEYAEQTFADYRPMPELQVPDHLGWHPQGDGRFYLGIHVPAGRVKDEGNTRYRSGLREIIARFRPRPVLHQNQDILLADIDPADRDAIEAMMQEYGIAPAHDISQIKRWSIACPALPTCGLALTEAERIREPLLERIEPIIERLGLTDERIAIRITGCPNGCAKSYAGDIGLVGRAPGYYALYLGGDFEGTRLSQRVVEKLPLDEIPDAFDKILSAYKAGRQEGEAFGNFCARTGTEQLAEIICARLAA